jgi:Fe-S-cluster containining protein
MHRSSWYSSALEGTSVEPRLGALEELYREAEFEMEDWKRKSGVACPDGCGTCCERFHPDILPVEAELVAAYLLLKRPDLLPRAETLVSEHCPFYAVSGPGHCTVYPVRPLICRLFGFAGERDKAGVPRFRLCRHMTGRGERSFTDGELLARFGRVPPLMQEYGMRLQSLEPRTGERLLVRDAVQRQLAALRFLLSLSDPDDNPPVQPEPISA